MNTVNEQLIRQFRVDVECVLRNLELASAIEDENMRQSKRAFSVSASAHDWLLKEMVHTAIDGVNASLENAYARLGEALVKHLMQDGLLEHYAHIDTRQKDNIVTRSTKRGDVTGYQQVGSGVVVLLNADSGAVERIVAPMTSLFYGLPYLYDLTIRQEFAGTFLSKDAARAAYPGDVQVREASQGWNLVATDLSLQATITYRNMEIGL